MVGSSFPYSEFLPEEGAGARRADRHRRPQDRHPLPDGGPARRRRGARRFARSSRCWSEARPLAGRSRSRPRSQDWWQLMERARSGARRPDQPAARVLGALAAAARRLHHQRRLGLGRELVRARPQAPRRHDGVALGDARDDGPRRPLRDRGEVRVPGPAGDRARRRRRDADERPRRADHGREVLAALERPAARRARAQQPRPQPGDVGAAGDGGRPDVRGDASRSPTSRTPSTPS